MSITISGRPIPSDWKRPARFGYVVIILTFAVGGGWAATAQIGSAVVAPAVVAIETNIKVVQHLEGGIIGETLVRENQHVDQGQVVLRLSDIQARASLATVTNQLMAARVQEARTQCRARPEALHHAPRGHRSQKRCSGGGECHG